MRLTAIKLSGFKSFVEPTTMRFAESLIGIVGPNGCGKSNLVDAVRWVLGESKAASLRGESIADVIFNGSENRKPVGRASVELIFNNSDGKIGGQWGQFSEISVRRLIDRTNESTYQINRQTVRRKDITGLFLGTGVGARGYSIIEQGTVSKLIEAKPDEIRLTLEEAAGVSKYRDRRKETENRLNDARGHLDRLADLNAELATQIEHLTVQAEQARRYREKVAERRERQAQQALFILNRAQGRGVRLADELLARNDELERIRVARTAVVAEIEQHRLRCRELSDELDAAQAAFYQANAEVIKIESESRHRAENLEKIRQRRVVLSDRRSKAGEEIERNRQRLETLVVELDAFAVWIAETTDLLDETLDRLDAAQSALAQRRESLDRVKREQTDCLSSLAVVSTQHRHATLTLDRLVERQAKLTTATQAIPTVSEADVEELEAALVDARETVEGLNEAIIRLQAGKTELSAEKSSLLEAIGALDRRRVEIDAQAASVRERQMQSGGNEALEAWLARHDLSGRAPLWQSLKIEAGFERAVEAVLRGRLSARPLFDLSAARAFVKNRPPVKLTFYASASLPPPTSNSSTDTFDWAPLSVKATSTRPEHVVVLAEWLAGAFVCGDPGEAMRERARLPDGACFVTLDGDIVTRNSISWFAEEGGDETLLSLQRRLDTLIEDRIEVVDRHDALNREKSTLDARLSEIEAELRSSRDELKSAETRVYESRLTLSTAIHRRTDALSQQERIERESVDLADQIEEAKEQQAEAEESMASFEDRLAEIEENIERERIAEAEAAEKTVEIVEQRKRLETRLNGYRIEQAAHSARQIETLSMIERLNDELDAIDAEIALVETELANAAAEPIDDRLTKALETRKNAEERLSQARSVLEEATLETQAKEGIRLSIEAQIAPIDEAITETRMAIQAQQLICEQQRQLLGEMTIDVESIEIPEGFKEGETQSRLRRLDEEIAAFGAVNLAAIDELALATERHEVLTRQMTDIRDAISQLEDAIVRIDRDARARLRKTFEIVDRNFGKLFPVLFGGGRARLEIEGDDLLSAGVRILAQPPGKRNSTISLLSGGEKALTAVALVFALFELNPAPFCLLDEIDAPLDDPNTGRLCEMIRTMSANTQFLFITHNKMTMEMAERLVGVTMPESGVSRVVDVSVADALRMSHTQDKHE